MIWGGIMNLLNSDNREIFSFSVSVLNTILFFMLLFFPTPFSKSIKIGILAIIILITLLTVIKYSDKDSYIIGDKESSSEKHTLYKQNLDIMNKFLKFKDLEVHNLEMEMSIKDKLYKQFFDCSPDAFIAINNNKITYFNDSFSKLIDSTDNTGILYQGVWDFIHPDSISKAMAAYNDLITKSTEFNIIDIKIVSSNNVIKDVRVSSNIIFFEHTHYTFSCFHDLSTHYEQERINAELENNVAQEKFKVEFFANISHDIKTPINVIYSAVQLQDMYLQADECDKIIVSNNVIKQNCLRLQKLLNDLLDITKIDANHFKPNLEFSNIICNIEHITQSVTSYIEHNEIAIIFDTNVEDKFVMTDLNFIERIMLNLISNAIKYGKPNGHVWVTLYDEGNHLIISVRDDGIGIPIDHISNIFKRFHKTNQCSGNTISSNGIGLSLVKSMVKALDGTIFCLSTEGIGSEFVIILPMESQEINDHDYSEYATSLDLSNSLNIELSDI